MKKVIVHLPSCKEFENVTVYEKARAHSQTITNERCARYFKQSTIHESLMCAKSNTGYFTEVSTQSKTKYTCINSMNSIEKRRIHMA